MVFTGNKLFDLVASVPLRLPGAENNLEPELQGGKLGRIAYNWVGMIPRPECPTTRARPGPLVILRTRPMA